MKRNSKQFEQNETHNQPKTKQPEPPLQKMKLSKDGIIDTLIQFELVKFLRQTYNEIFNEFITYVTCADKYNVFNKCIISVADL